MEGGDGYISIYLSMAEGKGGGRKDPERVLRKKGTR